MKTRSPEISSAKACVGIVIAFFTSFKASVTFIYDPGTNSPRSFGQIARTCNARVAGSIFGSIA